MRWRVEISEHSGDDRLLRDVLEATAVRLEEVGGRLVLAGDAFETRDTAAAVHEDARSIQSVLTEVCRTDPERPVSFQIGPVVEKLEGGGLRKHVFAYARGAGTLSGTGSVTVTVGPGAPVPSEEERKRIEEEKRELTYQEKRRKVTIYFVSALNFESALQVQRLLHLELTPMRMWHILEIIQDDMGVAIKDLASKNQLSRFERSVNHPKVHGEQARHIISRQQPPPKPMNLEEARAFVCGLAALWLEKKTRTVLPRGSTALQ